MTRLMRFGSGLRAAIQLQQEHQVKNTIALIQQEDQVSLGYGGEKVRRTYIAYINCMMVEIFCEDNPANGYSTGKYFDKHVQKWLDKYQNALGCKAIRGRVKGYKSASKEIRL